MSLYVLGDVHREWHRMLTLLMSTDFRANDVIVQVGDFGLGFRPPATDLADLRVINEYLQSIKVDLIVVRGNHDNPAYWSLDGPWDPLGEMTNIWLIPDYATESSTRRLPHTDTVDYSQVFDFAVLGGGVSVDRASRRVGANYWSDEIVPHDLPRAIKGIKHLFKHLKVLVSHESPSGMWPYDDPVLVARRFVLPRQDPLLPRDMQQGRDRLLEWGRLVQHQSGGTITHWYYGHYHQSYQQRVTFEDHDVTMRGLDILELIKHEE